MRHNRILVNKKKGLLPEQSSSFTQIAYFTTAQTALYAIDSRMNRPFAIGINSLGCLGDNSTVNKTERWVMPNMPLSIKCLSGGGSFAVALKAADGTAWSWGWGALSELGDNTINSRSSPVSVVGGHSFVKLMCGSTYSVALKSDGSMWSWGSSGGILGDNTTSARSSPVSVVGENSFVEFSAGIGTTHAIRGNDGTLWGWGSNTSGQIGDNSISTRSSPVSVLGENSYTHVADNIYFAAAVKGSDGSAWCWGNNNCGQLGTGGFYNQSSPVSVLGGHSWYRVGVGGSHTIAIRGDKTLWGWGLNSAGFPLFFQSATIYIPAVGITDQTFAKIGTGATHTVAIKTSDGTGMGWGLNTYGQQGDNSTTARSTPTAVSGGASYADVCTGAYHTLFRKSDGTAWGIGYNDVGALGDGTVARRSSPVSVLGGKSFSKLTAFGHSGGIDGSDGAAYLWGSNQYGSLGDNSTSNRSSPTSVVGGISFVDLAVGGIYHSGGIQGSDGSAWCWGAITVQAAYGMLGNNSTTPSSSPVSVVGGNSYSKIYCGYRHTLAMRGDGTVWAWGDNSYGQIGDGSAASRSSPVSVVGGHSFVEIAVGPYFNIGRKVDGTVWAWGQNTMGQLGVGDAVNRTSPTSVIGRHSFIGVAAGASHTVAIKANGEVYFWGSTGSSHLSGVRTGLWGNNNDGFDYYTSPISVVGGKSFSQLVVTLFAAYMIEESTGLLYKLGRDWLSPTGVINRTPTLLTPYLPRRYK